jgi:hypothetical protein
MKGTDAFPIQNRAIFRNFKEIGGIARRHTAVCRTGRFQTCHAQGVIEAEMAKKGPLWTDTNSFWLYGVYTTVSPNEVCRYFGS